MSRIHIRHVTTVLGAEEVSEKIRDLPSAGAPWLCAVQKWGEGSLVDLPGRSSGFVALGEVAVLSVALSHALQPGARQSPGWGWFGP